MNNRSYVYIHKLNETIVYVGMGSGKRLNSKTKRCANHLIVWDELEYIKVADGLTKEQAHDLEQKLLNEYFESGNLFNKCRTTNKAHILTYEEVSKHFYYDETSPSCLRRRCDSFAGRHNTIKVASTDDCAGSLNKSLGYYDVSMNNKTFKAHRLVYCLCNKIDVPSDLVIDHIDTNRANNTISNLRLVSTLENSRNKKHRKSNTGFQNIGEDLKKSRFSVSHCSNFKLVMTYFSYTPTSRVNSSNHYKSRDDALASALDYRNELVKQGVIILTGEK